MFTRMEAEVTGKGQRRKLKRVVQKKKKINLNNSASVVYYKKVKAALNGSLNASRVSQTLKANNKALAQSLQQVKQELRYSVNENSRLKAENQELTLKLLRLEKYVGAAPEQAGYEQRLQGLKAVLNNISQHLLDLGNCVGDGMDLCLLSPRSSVEEFKNLEMEASAPQPLPALDLDHLASESEANDQWEGEMYGDGMDHSSLSKMAPDMSIIMEQSIMVDSEEGQVPHRSCMTAVPEDSLENSKAGSDSKKVSALKKMPQRVLNGGNAKNSRSEAVSDSPEPQLKVPTSEKRPLSLRIKNKKVADHKNETALALASKSPHGSRRETYVVNKNVEKEVVGNGAETSGTGSVEDISDIPMPDLVSASPMKDDHEGEVFDTDTENHPKQSAGQQTKMDGLHNESQTEASSPNTVTVDKTGSAPDTACKEKRKSAGRKTESAQAKHTKTVAKASHITPLSKKDADFFISNPCTLNLVHKRVTGSSEGCLDPAQQSQEPSQSESTVDQFMAHIKESNRNSTKLASFLVVDEANATQKPCKSNDAQTSVNKPRRSSGAGFEFQSEDQTVYFNSDMEFTEVLPQSQNLAQEQVRKGTTNVRKEEAKTQLKGKKKEQSRQGESQMARSKSGLRSESNKESSTEHNGEVDIDKQSSGPDKKLAVALRVNRPGQMVFAASRKEEDGSRKAIPAKLQSRSRSKSKKQVEEMAKHLPKKEPECIFDFHDQTPRSSATEGKANHGHGSVFDLSLNDTVPGGATSLASHREKLRACNNLESTEESGLTNKAEKASSVLLGDAPVYSVPLKDDSCDLEPRPRSRGRSSSKSKDTGRRSRSQNRSRKEEKEQDSELLKGDCSESELQPRSRGRSSSRSKNSDRQKRSQSKSRKEETEKISPVYSPDHQNKRSRSRSCTRTKSEIMDDDGSKEDGDENITSNVCNKRKSESAPNAADDKDTAEKPRRSARSRSRTHKCYNEDSPADDSISSTVSSPKEKKAVRGRSRSRAKKYDNDDDEDYQPSVRTQPRGRSRRRQGDEQGSESNTEQEKPAQFRSRSRRRDVTSQLNDMENESSTNVKPVNQDTQEPLLNSASIEKSPVQQPTQSIECDDFQGKLKDKQVNEETSVESNSPDKESMKLVTDRRQRSKSSFKKLYSEAEISDDPFGFSDAVDKTNSDPQSVQQLGKQVRQRTRSRGTGLLDKESTGNTVMKDSSQSLPESSSKQDGAPDKRKISGHTDSERDVSPTKRLCTDRKSLSDPEKIEGALKEATGNADGEKVAEKQTEHNKESSTNAESSTLVLKKRKSGLPVAVFQAEEVEKTRVSPAVGKTKSKSVSKLPEPKSSEKGEKTKYQLEFEDLKRKLKEMNPERSTGDADVSSHPVKKSRPLILPTTSSSTAAPGSKKPPSRLPSASDTEQANSKAATDPKKGRSRPGSPKVRKSSKCLPCSPVSKTSTSLPSSATSSPQLAEDRSSLSQSEPSDESSQADGRRGRRAAASVCYKEPSLNAKLRRGDPHTTFLHKDQMMHIYKSPKTHRKNGRSELMNRSALHDLTNSSIMEADNE